MHTIRMAFLAILSLILVPACWAQGESSKPLDATGWMDRVQPDAVRPMLFHWYGMRARLEKIGASDPALAERAKKALKLAEERFAGAVGAIDAHYGKAGASWREDVEDIKQTVAKRPLEGEPEKNLKRIETELAGGPSEEPIGLLLAFSPRYNEAPQAEIADGFRAPLSTRGLEDASGLDMSMVMPESWNYKEPTSENIVLVRRSHGGAGDAQFVVFVKEIPEDERADLARGGGARAFADPDYVKLLGGRPLDRGERKVGGEDAFWTRFFVTQDKNEPPVKAVIWSLHMFQDKWYVNLQWSVARAGATPEALPSDEQLTARLEHYRPLIETVLESVVFAKSEAK